MAMKKLYPLFLVLLVVAFVTPALAANVDADVRVVELFAKADVVVKVKATLELKVIADVYLTTINKSFDPDSRVMAEVVKKQINEDNEFALRDNYYSDKIQYSFNEFKGIGQANQAAGSMNNQANVVSAAVTNQRAAWANAEVIDYQLNDHLVFDPKAVDPAASFTDLIDNSFNKFSGVGQANQAAGMANNQSNIVAIAFSTNGAKVAESDVNLDQVNVNNFLSDSGVTRTNTITNSFNNFQGIGQANQSAGNFNNQSNVVAFAGGKSGGASGGSGSSGGF
jgi:hypothetical protein